MVVVVPGSGEGVGVTEGEADMEEVIVGYPLPVGSD